MEAVFASLMYFFVVIFLLDGCVENSGLTS